MFPSTSDETISSIQQQARHQWQNEQNSHLT
jgi:hypothetical protein